jgi:high affinity sulfate transporter 1
MSMSSLFTKYQKDWLRWDVMAGLTTASVVIPKSLAYAGIAGLPLETGLYVAFIPMLVYAFLGTSRTLSVSTTTTIAILTGAELAVAVPGGDPGQLLTAAAMLAMLTGAFLLLAGVLRLGFLANFISDPVLAGFKAGIGVVIIVDHLPKLMGLHVKKTGFFQYLWSIATHIPQAHLLTLGLAVVALALLFGLKHYLPKSPGPLVAVVLGIAAAGLFGLKEAGVALTGNIPSGIPTPAMPDLRLAQSLWPGALGIALMSFAETIAAGRAFARYGDPRPKANQELIALGAANIAGSFFRSFPAGGGTSQTAVNAGAGARSQMSELVTVVMVAATLLFLAPLISLLPMAILAAIVVITCLPMLSLSEFRSILLFRRTEFAWALFALAGVVLLGTLQGILVAIGISMLTLLYQGTHPPVYALGRKPGTDVFRPLSKEHPEDEVLPGLLILRTEGRINFASGPRVGERMWPMVNEAKPRVVILECSAILDIEYTALKSLIEAEINLSTSGISLWMAGLNPEAYAAVQRSPLGKALGRPRMYFNLPDAVRAFEQGNAPA